MRRLLIATPLLVLTAAACTGTGSYKDQTEDFINDSSEVQDAAGGDIDGADCEEPDSTDVGTTYTCTAEVEGVGATSFGVTIDKEDSFLVNDITPPG